MLSRAAIRALLVLGWLIILAAPFPGPLFARLGPARAADILSIVPPNGPPYTEVSVSVDAGTFIAGSTVSATFQDAAGNPAQPLATGTAAADGSARLSGVIPFRVTVGNAGITVTGTAGSGLFSLHSSFLVQPAVYLSPSHGPANTSLPITVSGAGFAPNARVAFSDNGVPIMGSGTVSGSDGSFAAVSLTIMTANMGNIMMIGASDSTGAQGQTSFSIDSSLATATPLVPGTTAGLAISPASGPPGSAGITISSGAGAFSGASGVALVFTDQQGNTTTLQSVVPVSTSGAISATVSLPAQAVGGAALITAQGSGFAPLSGQFQITPTIALSPTVVPPGGVLSVTGDGFTANRTISFTIGGISATTTAPITVSTAGHFAVSFTLPPTVPLGATILSAGDGSAAGPVPASFTVGTPVPAAAPTATATAGPTAPQGSGGVTSAYFAEGYTGLASTNATASFTETLNLLNPSSTTVPITITYFNQDGSPPITIARTIPPTTAFSESVNADVGPDKIVGAEVTAAQPMFVTRTILRRAATGARLDGSTALPETSPETNWAFPEGYTGISFQEYLILLNPSTAPAMVTVTLAPQAASAVGARVLTIMVPAQSRRTANIRALNLSNPVKSVGMVVSSTVPIVAERVEYFGDGAGSGKFGSIVSPGIPAPATQVRFPVLSSGGTAGQSQGPSEAVGDQAYITILNPATAGSPVQVAAAFTNASGAAIGSPVTVDVPPGTRQTIAVNAVLGSTPFGPVSAVLNASGPIDAEAAQYAGGSPNASLHPGIGFAGSATSTTGAALTDLATILNDGTPVQRTLFLFNPTALSEQIAARYVGPGGTVADSTYTVTAGGILTISVNQDTQSIGTANVLGVELRVVTPASGGFLAASAGVTIDGLSVTENAGFGY